MNCVKKSYEHRSLFLKKLLQNTITIFFFFIERNYPILQGLELLLFCMSVAIIYRLFLLEKVGKWGRWYPNSFFTSAQNALVNPAFFRRNFPVFQWFSRCCFVFIWGLTRAFFVGHILLFQIYSTQKSLFFANLHWEPGISLTSFNKVRVSLSRPSVDFQCFWSFWDQCFLVKKFFPQNIGY